LIYCQSKHGLSIPTNANYFGIEINENLNVLKDYEVTRDNILSSYRKTILMLASQEVKAAAAKAEGDSFNSLIDGIIVNVSANLDNNYTTNLETFRTGGSNPILTQILDTLVEKVRDTGRGGGRSRYNKRSIRRRRSSKARKSRKARSTRRR
jgi:hypothetical protein